MRIDTDVESIIVEIEDKEYQLAPRTVDVLDKLASAGKAAQGKPAYKLWLAELEVLMGKPAVAALFHSGKAENVDRLQSIYTGVADAFNHHAADIEADRANAKLEAVATALAPINELLKQVRALDNGDDKKVIHRG